MSLQREFFNQYKDELLFVPLGGANKMGCNAYLYHYQGHWLMIDCGAGYVSSDSNDLLIPDLSFAEQLGSDLLGLVVTHAHEDHIGAILYTWDKLRCPIFASEFTINVLKERLKNTYFFEQIEFVKVEEKIVLGYFSLQFIHVPHSIAETLSVILCTKNGNIWHTGDWRFDDHPIVGGALNSKVLEKYAHGNVFSIVSDSSGIFEKGHSISELEVGKSLRKILLQNKGMTLVTTYPSNIARVTGIINEANSLNKKIVMSGRQMSKFLSIAKASGYLHSINNIIDNDEISKFKREEIVVLASGCDGEYEEAVRNIVENHDPYIKILPGDCVIFSSKITARNSGNLASLIKKMKESGASVITDRDNLVHVQPHATEEDIRSMYKALQPKICIPVHGTDLHINQHTIVAKECGIPYVVKVCNGDVVAINMKEPKVIASVAHGTLKI